VPRADYDQALARATNAEQALAEEKKHKLESEIETAVNQALQEGKIVPATADYYKAQCRQDGGLAAFKKFCESAPVIGDPSNLDGKDPANGTGTALNAAEKEVCERMGINEDEYRKTAI
jgi:phage I-like protein